MRLALFIDAAFRRGPDGRIYAGDELLGFSTFAAAVGSHVGGLTLIGRETEDEAATPHRLSADVSLDGLPFYSSLRDLRALARALPATCRALWSALGETDVLWVSASNPVGLIAMALAKMRRRRVAILVRQDSMEYFRRRLPGSRWKGMLAPLWAVDRVYRLAARRWPTTAVGAQIASLYGGNAKNVLAFTVNLTRAADLVDPAERQAPGRPFRMLTVGRIEPEKNPLLLAEVLADLDGEDAGDYCAVWAGEWRLREDLAARAGELGVGEMLECPGFVPAGPELTSLYDRSDALVHIALTEGVPGVLGEAMGRGLPVIATDVGGIRASLPDGAALLVAPGDAAAMAAAVRTVAEDAGRRSALTAAGSAFARSCTLESESERVARFLEAA